MTTCFTDAEREADFDRYRQQWESAALAAALSGASLDTFERKQLARTWVNGSFNGAAHGVYDPRALGESTMEWLQAGPTQYDLVYASPYGVVMPLGRVYQQPDGSWGALVIAGVKDDPHMAMAAAEWAIGKLTA